MTIVHKMTDILITLSVVMNQESLIKFAASYNGLSAFVYIASTYVYIHTYIHTHTHTHTHSIIRTYVHTYVHHRHVPAYIRTYILTYLLT
jgi:hypothetical protein